MNIDSQCYAGSSRCNNIASTSSKIANVVQTGGVTASSADLLDCDKDYDSDNLLLHIHDVLFLV